LLAVNKLKPAFTLHVADIKSAQQFLAVTKIFIKPWQLQNF